MDGNDTLTLEFKAKTPLKKILHGFLEALGWNGPFEGPGIDWNDED